MRPSVRKFFARQGFRYIPRDSELLEYMVRRDGTQVKVLSKVKSHPITILDRYGFVKEKFDEFNSETLINYLKK